jgi:RHS repeat-associated protein
MPGTETVIDDAGPETTRSGNWEQVRKKGSWLDYYHRSGDSNASFRWHPSDLTQARYAVYAWWPKSRKNNPGAQFRIRHGSTTSTAIVSQARDGKQWVKLGTYAFDGSGDEYIELSDQGGLTAADGIRLVELVEPPPVITTRMYYFHNDRLGTPRVVTDQAGAIAWQANYSPFGQADLVVANIEQNLRFPGQYFDSETGLHYNYHRDYDPALGRYLQSDPIGLAGGMSTYGYAQNNPYVFSDPTGLLSVAEANTIGSTIGGAIGGGINGALSGAGIGTTAGTVLPGIGNLAGGVIGAALGAARGAAGGAVAGAASAELGVGGASLVAAVTNGPMAGAASLSSEVARSLLPAPASQLGGGFLGGAIGGISGGPLAVIGGAYGGVIGGAISAAICLGDSQCRKELLEEDNLCE